MKYLKVAAVVAIVLLLGLPQAHARKRGPSVTIGKERITQERFEQLWDALPAGKRQMYEKQGGQEQFLEELVSQKLLTQEARRRKLDRDATTAIEIELAEERILYKAIYDSDVVGVVIPEADMTAYYEENKEKFAQPEMVQARHILVTPKQDRKIVNESGEDAEDEDSAKAQIAKIQDLLSKGEDFEVLARKYSEGPTASKGGHLGYFSKGRMVKPFEDAAFALEAGQVSEVVQTNFGYHLIYVIDRKAAAFVGFEDMRDNIRTTLARERREAIWDQYKTYLEELREKYNVEIADGFLDPEKAKGRGGEE